MTPAGSTATMASMRTDGCAQNKWHLLRIVEDAREPLNLKSTTLNLLRAMLSFLRTDVICPSSDAAHICFASNATLAERAHVSVQTVERHISKLVQTGLIKRRCSANGKRWARRDGQGAVVLVSGLSLLPMVERMEELLHMAEDEKNRQNKLSLLKDRCRLALTELKDMARTDVRALLQAARNILRRKSDETELEKLLSDIASALGKTASDTVQQPIKMRGKPTDMEGHKETYLNPKVKEKNSSLDKVTPKQIEDAYPKLCAELRFAKSQSECSHIMDHIAQCLHLGTQWPYIKALGHMQSFMILGYIYERADTLHSPSAYAQRLMKDVRTDSMNWASLLKKPKPDSSAAIKDDQKQRTDNFAVLR